MKKLTKIQKNNPRLMDINQTSLAGEFFVLAQLSMRGYVGTLTLGHTKGVDILASNPKTGRLFQLEVKTTSRGPYNSTIFGRNHEWMMNEKHENINGENLFYCFTFLNKPDEMPRFFIIPSKVVAKYVTGENAYWLKQPHRRAVKKTSMRTFRIGLTEVSHGLRSKDYENRWDFFDRKL